MDISQFLSYLHSLNVKLRVDGVNGVPPQEARLYCINPQTLTPELSAQLRSRKVEILKFLQDANLTSSSITNSIKPVPRNGNLPLSFA